MICFLGPITSHIKYLSHYSAISANSSGGDLCSFPWHASASRNIRKCCIHLCISEDELVALKPLEGKAVEIASILSLQARKKCRRLIQENVDKKCIIKAGKEISKIKKTPII